MQFNLVSLILLCLLAACFMAFHQYNVVWALGLSSFCVSAYSLNKPGRRKDASFARLAVIGAASASAAVLVFGLITIAVYWVDLAIEGSLPASKDLEMSYEKYLLYFVITYGGCAAFGGFFLGAIVYGLGTLLDYIETSRRSDV